MVLQHQVRYLNLVHAFRAVTGHPAAWFEDFVRYPSPAAQFRYPLVVGPMLASGDIELSVLTVDQLVAGGGLPRLLAAAGLEPSLPGLPSLEVEEEPDASDVDVALLARRLFDHRQGDEPGPDPTDIVKAVLEASRTSRVDRGPFWGWTPGLLVETAGRFRRDNERLHDVTGLRLVPPAPRPTNRFALRDASPDETRGVLDALDTVVPSPPREDVWEQ